MREEKVVDILQSQPWKRAYAFLGMFINETIDNKVRKTTCEEARKVCFSKKIMELVKLQIDIYIYLVIKHMHFVLQEINQTVLGF